jgi:cyclic-di-AMP phosphodiesterase PgpH
MHLSISELQDLWKSVRKSFLNLVLFLLSTIIVIAVWPHNSGDKLSKVIGICIVVSSCYLVLYLFLSHFRPEVLKVAHKTVFILLIILVFTLMTRLVVIYTDERMLFLIPFVFIPVIIRTFYDARLALFILLITIMLAGFMVSDPFRFIFMSFISGMVAIFTLTNVYRRARLFLTAISVVLSYSVLYLGLNLITYANIKHIELSFIWLFLGNGIFVLAGYPVIIIFEKKFRFLSDNTLLELADTDQPLLRKLAEEAPGSFQHSLQVANLAEAAARIIGANLLLVRTGALYHDIGKIAHPEYFIENQLDGSSPHENLNPEDSAKVIINHVKNGQILAKNFKLPEQIIDFILTHHGTTMVYFFFKMYTDLNPWDTSRESAFIYPGPKPFSKETAVVMMADAVEASSRSLTDYTVETISEMVERVIYLQEHDGQFSDIPLTFKDISDIKEAFKKRLSNIYHVRVAYPGRKLQN